MNRRAGWASVLTALVLTMSGCAQPTTDPHAGHGGQPHNAADVAFARNMIPHHRQGVDLAAMVPARTTNADLRVIATHIGVDQQAEIQTLNALLAQWHEEPGHPADHSGHAGMPMTGMVDQGTLNKLESLDGAAFDLLWTKSMISHHEGAVTMAQDEIANGESADAIDLATMIVEAQQREIAIMTHLISATE